MKSIPIITLLLISITINKIHSAKSIKGLHPARRRPRSLSNNESHNFGSRISKRVERKLSLFGPSEIEQEMDEASEHSHMVMMMNMMDKNAKVGNIVKYVKQFSDFMDDLHETVGAEISQLSSVAANHITKNLDSDTI